MNPCSARPRLVCFAGLLLACFAGLLLGQLTGQAASGQSAPSACSLDLESTQMQWQWIGRRTSEATACPEPQPVAGETTSWEVDELFDTAAADQLGRYCRYRASSADADPAELPLADLEQVEMDLMAISAQAPSVSPEDPANKNGASDTGLKDLIWRPLRVQYHQQIGREERAEPATTAGVRLAVLDTAPTNSTEPHLRTGNSPHGYTLIHMARDLLCEGSACAVEVTARLALAYLSFDPDNRNHSVRDEENGGYFGSVSDLAAAIHEEVLSAPDDTKLVINISGGWPETELGDMPLAVRAVHTAIEVLRCRGGLVVAAAGNKGCGASADCSRPLLPAAWEKRAAPDWERCEALLDGMEDLDPGDFLPGYRPLVYAVGGVRSDGEPLPNARPHSEPAIVAYGHSAVVTSHLPGVPTATLTGSSVASVSAAAIAAGIWSCNPELNADGVMEALYNSGQDLSRTPDICNTAASAASCAESARPTVRRIRACPAFADVCGQSSSSCSPWSELPPNLSEEVNFTPFNSAAELAWIGDTVSQAASVCLTEKPWLTPQPGSDPCPSCIVLSRGGGLSSLMMEIASNFQGTLTEPVLNDLCSGSSTSLPVLGTLNPGQGVKVEGISTSCSDLEISFTVNQFGTVVSPVLVAP